MLRELVPSHDDSVQVSRVREARRELEDIFQREMQHENGSLTAGMMSRATLNVSVLITGRKDYA